MKLSRTLWTLLVILIVLPIGVMTNVATGDGGGDDPALPDLVPAYAPGSTFEYHSRVGDTPDFYFYVHNAGSVASAGVYVDVRFKDSSDVYHTVRSNDHTGELAPGQTHTGLIVERPDISWPAGDMDIQITVDPNNLVTESNENNNVQLASIIG